jgi:hypothetical protein
MTLIFIYDVFNIRLKNGKVRLQILTVSILISPWVGCIQNGLLKWFRDGTFTIVSKM